MTQLGQLSSWNSPLIFLLVTTWALIVGVLGDMIVGDPILEPNIAAYAVGLLAFPYGVGVMGAMLDWIVGHTRQANYHLLGTFNATVAFVCLVLSLWAAAEVTIFGS